MPVTFRPRGNDLAIGVTLIGLALVAGLAACRQLGLALRETRVEGGRVR